MGLIAIGQKEETTPDHGVALRRPGSNDPVSQFRRSHLQIQPTNTTSKKHSLTRRSHTRPFPTRPALFPLRTPPSPLVTLMLASDHKCNNFNTRRQMTHGRHFKPPGVQRIRSSRVKSIWLQQVGLSDRGGDHTTVNSHISIHTKMYIHKHVVLHRVLYPKAHINRFKKTKKKA